MTKKEQAQIADFMDKLGQRVPYQQEFFQAVEEVAKDIIPFMMDNPKYGKDQVFERMTEPERTFIFRVPWTDDKGNIQFNRGYRVHMNSAIGPYKGGLRFHPSVNLSILKFLAFEQTFKNSLTTLPMGGAKGGSNFDPKGKSDSEVMRFCQSFMTELSKYIGKNTDIPAGDIGVGGREIGYMFGQYKRITGTWTGVLTGKGESYGGSAIRTESTGYGTVYFATEALKQHTEGIDGKTCLVSGAGNVAQYATEKLIECGGKVLTLSDSQGFIHVKDGITKELLDEIKVYKNEKRASLADFAKANKKTVEYHANKRPWAVKGELAFPCATQNEIEKEDAKTLVKNGCIGVFEGANMPSTMDAIDIFQENHIIYTPGKAANAGGVATSGLEMTQNSQRLYWTREEVDEKLYAIMRKIHQKCVDYGKVKNAKVINYAKGANIGGFVKVAEAMLAQGAV